MSCFRRADSKLELTLDLKMYLDAPNRGRARSGTPHPRLK